MAVKKSPHTAAELKAVLTELEHQTDRGAGIIAASVLEELLAVVIQDRLLPLNSELRQALFDRPNAPLRGFSAKISLGFALGLYSQSGMNSLHMLRETRNAFAHRIEALTFEHPDILKVVSPFTDRLKGDDATTRDKFLYFFRTMSMILLGQCGQNIRIPEISPDITVRTLSVISPEHGSILEEVLREVTKETKEK